MSISDLTPAPIDWVDEEERIAPQAIAAGDPTGWFETLYAAGESGRITMPWSREEPHALLVEWARARALAGAGRRAVVVGCGLGADSEYLASLGFSTTGFDVSPTAVNIARRRHPETTVRYVAADLLDPPREWLRAFDLVVEIITVQALPDPPRSNAIINVGRLLAAGGTLLVVAAVDEDGCDDEPPPWPLRRDEVEAFATDGLEIATIEIVALADSPEHRWRAEFFHPHHPAPGATTERASDT
jgi:SAM-dependent methyltransferase